MSIASVALDAQMDQLRWVKTTQGTRYCNGVCNVMLGENVNNTDDFGTKLHAVILAGAATYAVATDICDLIESAAATIPPFAIKMADLPSSAGFVFFERPIVVLDSKGKDLVVKAIAWHLAKPSPDVETIEIVKRKREGGLASVFGDKGIVMLLWTDPTDQRDHMHEEWNETSELRRSSNASWPRYLSMLGGTWNFDEEPHSDVGKLLLTFLRFIQERWVDNRHVVADRHAMRRAKRVREGEPNIRVIRLRRAAPKKRREGDPEPVEWSHRWIVSPHWRNQWYPSLGEHRPKFIWSYVKGPENKPLIINDTVFVVDR